MRQEGIARGLSLCLIVCMIIAIVMKDLHNKGQVSRVKVGPESQRFRQTWLLQVRKLVS
jgi:hypothetical protein